MNTESKAKRFANALVGKVEVQLPRQPKEVLELPDMVAKLATLTDMDWGMYSFSREPLERKFNRAQKQEYIRKATECGIEEARKIKEQYTFQDNRELAEKLGMKVLTPDGTGGGTNIIFAQFVEPDTITVYMDTLRKAKVFLKNQDIQEATGNPDAFEVLLAHELFHWVEYCGNKNVFTQTEKIELWRKPFSNKSRILCLGEIAGMAFAKELVGMKVSPFIYDVIFMYGYNKESASALYENILEIIDKESEISD